ncbi:hypothetical protein Y032_0003g1633 [Ancylostoma ceylanicum]|uniref:SCP domain-containing protein n=1 Tax=Ancylostoma ceylanicum TaxID=53326 RepID=A0A016VY93_9BILA|nr:hypothetical protein Y032_0003g1633 [Ancylostoma ceylanicum]
MENAVNDAQQLCLHSEKASCKGKSLTDAQRQLLISEHNKIRRMIAKGNAENYDGGKLPSGRNIYQLRYSCELENAAIASVKGATCSASLADPQKYGQNIHVNILFCHGQISLCTIGTCKPPGHDFDSTCIDTPGGYYFEIWARLDVSIVIAAIANCCGLKSGNPSWCELTKT